MNANESTPLALVPPAATPPAGNSQDVNANNSTLSPLALELSNIERSSVDERPSRSFNSSQHRLERQNAIADSPPRHDDLANASIVSAIERNTEQLREMFGSLAKHVDEIEKKINGSSTMDSDAE